MRRALFLIPVLLLSCAPAAHQRSAEHWNQQGFAHREAGEYEQAEAAFTKAVRLEPTSAAGHNNLGRLYFVQGRYEEAVASFERAAEFRPSGAGIYRNLGASYARLGRYGKAASALRRAVAINPDDVEARWELGVVSILGGDTQSALEQYESLRGLDSGRAEELFRMMSR